MTYSNREPGVFHCDECPEHIETGETDFSAALEAARAQGWRRYKGPDKEWADGCPACVEQFAKSKQ